MNSHTSPDSSAPECAATHPVGAVCTRPAGHEGDHQDARSDAPATLNWGPDATARLAYPTTTDLPDGTPAKVRRVVQVIEREARPGLAITVEQDDTYPGLWFIRGERYPGTLAYSSLHTSVSMRRRGSGSLGRTRSYYLGGTARELTGWRGLARLAALS